MARTFLDMQKGLFSPNSPSKFLTKINMVEQNYWDGMPAGSINEDFESMLNGLDLSLEEDGLGEDWDSSVFDHLLGPIPSDINEFPETQGNVLFQTQSPIPVLENSRSCPSGMSASFNFGTKGHRSKRARWSNLNPWLLMPPMPCTTSAAAKKISDAERGKEKKRKLLGAVTPTLFKRCTHCEVTETPQWREGPLGPKTLCNACGVRYRSGRLLPEYRPAASPTFTPSLHSNSHRKVVEMRRKAIEESPQCDTQTCVSLNSYFV